MSMREEFEKWFEGYAPFAPEHLDDCAFAAWQAAYLAGAKAMQEEAAKACSSLVNPSRLSDPGRSWITGTTDCADAIRAINPENLLAVE